MRVSRILMSVATAVALVGLTGPAAPASPAPPASPSPPASPASPASPAPPASPAQTLSLHGGIIGRWHVEPSTLADAGQRYVLFRGYGNTSLGVTGARGESGSLGNVRAANCRLELRVTTASPQGQISVQISSLDQFPGGASCKVYNFRWRASKMTGAYAGRFGSGTGSLALRNPTAAGADGTFRVYFH
jgi:hypothetical protein